VNENESHRKSLAGPLFVILLCQIGLLGLDLADRSQGQPATVKSNSAIFLAGVTGVAISTIALWKHGFTRPWPELISVLSLAIGGLVCLYFVSLPLIGASGIVVSAPFLVPIVVALTRKHRNQ
jgi:hypothetical protein